MQPRSHGTEKESPSVKCDAGACSVTTRGGSGEVALLVGHLFIYMAETLFLSEFYSYIYWSVYFQIHACTCYRISNTFFWRVEYQIHLRTYWYGILNILLIVLSQARLFCHDRTSFFLPSGSLSNRFFYHVEYIVMNSSDYFRPLHLHKIWRCKFFFF